MASKVLDALQQMGQPMMTPPIMPPRAGAPQDRFLSNAKAGSSRPQMAQVAVEVIPLCIPVHEDSAKRPTCSKSCQVVVST